MIASSCLDAGRRARRAQVLWISVVVVLVLIAGVCVFVYFKHLRPVLLYNDATRMLERGNELLAERKRKEAETEYVRAAEKLQEALRYKKNFGEAHINLALCFYGSDRIKPSRDLLEKSLAHCTSAIDLFEAGNFVQSKNQTSDKKLEIARKLEDQLKGRLAAPVPAGKPAAKTPAKRSSKG